MQHPDSHDGNGGGVVCEFVRQRCTHDALFQPFYKRSNRTKGSKILRCFPHCCPSHAHRGFCGSSLHVRVEWPSASAGLHSPPPPPSIHVLARFRLSDTPRLPLGHVLEAAAVISAVQSDDTPNDEWIDSQMIYSWSETNWLFEINSAARWFYGWESSTVKSQRLKDHVLDVYVLVASSSAGADVFRVAAVTTSPSFQLISFRRATNDAMLALSATHHVRQQLQNGGSGGAGGGGGRGGGADPHIPPHHQHHYPEEEKTHVFGMGPRPPLVRYHDDVPPGMPSGPPHPAPPPSGRPFHHLRAPIAHTSVPVTRPLSLPSLRPPLSTSAGSASSSVSQWTAPPLASSAVMSRPLTTLAPLAPLHRPPPSFRAYPLQSPPPPPQSSRQPALLRPTAFAPPSLPIEARPQTVWRPPQLAITRPPTTTTTLSSSSSSALTSSSAGSSSAVGSGGRDSAAWEVLNLLGQLHQIPLVDVFERVAWIHETYVQYATEYANEAEGTTEWRSMAADAEMSVRRALASLGLYAASSPTRKLPSRLLATLTELAVWLLFDPATVRQLQGAALSATETLADPSLVRRYYSRAVFFLHDHIGRFLYRRFQTTIHEVLRECETLGLQLQHETDADTSAIASPGSAVDGGERGMKGQDAFVAQAREVLIAMQRVANSTKRPQLHLHSPSSRLVDVERRFNRQWTCALGDVLVHRTTSSPLSASSPLSLPRSPPPPSSLSLLTLLWFYRQFSAVALTLDCATHALRVRSLFALTSPLASQLVLDGRDRFCHAFPAGDATLATSVGRYAFGDYTGAISSSASSTIRLQLYAFLTPAQLPRDVSTIERIASDACVCYSVTLRVASDHASLAVDVVVQTGALDVATLRRAGHSDACTLLRDMATWTLREKLAAVRGFEDTSRVELVYHIAV